MNTHALSLWRAYYNKVTNKLWGVVHVPAQGKKKGDVLLSYITGPFTQAPGEYFTDPHSVYWESAEVARLISERGYAVDVIDSREHRFVPKKSYFACIDIQQDLGRLEPYLPAECKKVLHMDSLYCPFFNEAGEKRLEQLRSRRGIELPPQRRLNPEYCAKKADYLTGLGNATTHATYASFKKEVFRIPISVTKEFEFPAYKDFTKARKEFLWFGGGDPVLKGLDLVLEAFAAMPELILHVVGPSAYDPEFAKAYARELALPNIKRYPRPKLAPDGTMLCGTIPFMSIADHCAAQVYLSISEGTSGAVVQAMHAGVIPIVTPQTGLQEDAPALLLEDPTIESISKTVRIIANSEPENLELHAAKVWRYARANHSKTAYRAAWTKFFDDILHL